MHEFPIDADAVKKFGMTNQLLEADLDKVEQALDLDLGRTHGDAEDKDVAYYPQFDEEIRAEAARMSEHYEVFYCLEKTIRILIADTLFAEESAAWWDTNRVPEGVRKAVADRSQREMDSGVTLRSSEPIDYTTFGELGEIIKKNWDLFGSVLNSARAVEKVMANLNVLRGPIAHCSALAEDEILRLQLSLRDWFRMME